VSRDDVARRRLLETLVGTKLPCGQGNTRVVEVVNEDGAEAIVATLEAAGFAIVPTDHLQARE
jgi:hypothetical protein